MPLHDSELSVHIGSVELPLLRRGRDTAVFRIVGQVVSGPLYLRMFTRARKLGIYTVLTNDRPFLKEMSLRMFSFDAVMPATYTVRSVSGEVTEEKRDRVSAYAVFGTSGFVDVTKDDSLRADFTLEGTWKTFFNAALKIDDVRHLASGTIHIKWTGSIMNGKTRLTETFVRFKDMPCRAYTDHYRLTFRGAGLDGKILEMRQIIDDQFQSTYTVLQSYDAKALPAAMEIIFTPYK
jgi:hypothetical protein